MGSPGAGLVVDFFASRYRKKNKELRGRTIGVAVVCAFCSISSGILSLLCAQQYSYSISVIAQITFSFIRTFLYAICAQAAFLLFPANLFGLIYGSLQLFNGLLTLTAVPLFSFIKNELEGDYTLVHYGIAIACFLSLFEPFVLVCYKPK